MKKVWILLVIFLPTLFISCGVPTEPHVIDVVDGDTIKMSDESKIRIFGINTPESFDKKRNFKSTTGMRGYYATLAKNYLKRWLTSKHVTTEYIKLDPYRRKVSKVYAGDNDVAVLLLKHGLARMEYISTNPSSLFYTKDTSYYNMLVAIEKNAKKHKIGIWSVPSIKQIFP